MVVARGDVEGGDDGGEKRVVVSAVGGNRGGGGVEAAGMEVVLWDCEMATMMMRVMVSGDWWCGNGGGWPESGRDLAGKERDAPKNYKEGDCGDCGVGCGGLAGVGRRWCRKVEEGDEVCVCEARVIKMIKP
ncbi:hypothetical protein Tco_0319276 [Tanacetum coccineum]